ncbi:UNVERIFIED_CONTAM: hypothetical protein K2H54_057807 [Gekko kuhli]
MQRQLAVGQNANYTPHHWQMRPMAPHPPGAARAWRSAGLGKAAKRPPAAEQGKRQVKKSSQARIPVKQQWEDGGQGQACPWEHRRLWGLEKQPFKAGLSDADPQRATGLGGWRSSQSRWARVAWSHEELPGQGRRRLVAGAPAE